MTKPKSTINIMSTNDNNSMGVANYGLMYRYDRTSTFGTANYGLIHASGEAIPNDYVLRYKLDNSGAGFDADLVPNSTEAFETGPAKDDLSAGVFVDTGVYYTDVINGGLVSVGTNSCTITTWVNTSESAIKDIFSSGNGTLGDGTFSTRYNSSGGYRLRIESVSFNGVGIINDGDWHHLAFVLNGSGNNGQAYIDGEFDMTLTSAAYNFTGTPTMSIGASPAGARNMNGSVDDARFYDRALNENEIKALYIDSVIP